MFIDKQNLQKNNTLAPFRINKKKKKSFCQIVVTMCFFSLVLLMGGCQSHAKHLKAVKINLQDEPHSLDPRLARDLNSQTLMRMFFEGLTRMGPGDLPQLALAESIKISEDLKTYIFTLKDAKWSNGDPVVAGDFVYSWRKILSPQFASDHAFQLYVLKNGKSIKEGIREVEELGAKAIDEKTLLVELEYPIPYALELFSAPYFSPVNQKIDRENPRWAEKVETYVSNGPFLLKKWSHHDFITALKNPSYWEACKVQLEEINMVMLSSDVEMALFEKGELDWCGSPLSVIPVDALKALKTRKSYHVKPRAETAFLRANTKKPLLDDPKMRHALALAIDREAIVEHITQGGQIPAKSLVPPSLQPIKKEYIEDHAIEKGKILFEEILQANGLTRKEFPKLNLTYINTERNHLMAQAIQQQWFEVFKIRISLEGIERKIYFDRIAHQDFDLAFCSWGADYHDPLSFLEVFKYKSQSTNNTNWEDQEYAQKLNESCRKFNPDERNEILTQCESILMEAMPIIPLFHYSMNYMKNERLKGVFVSSLGGLDFKWASLGDEE